MRRNIFRFREFGERFRERFGDARAAQGIDRGLGNGVIVLVGVVDQGGDDFLGSLGFAVGDDAAQAGNGRESNRSRFVGAGVVEQQRLHRRSREIADEAQLRTELGDALCDRGIAQRIGQGDRVAVGRRLSFGRFFCGGFRRANGFGRGFLRLRPRLVERLGGLASARREAFLDLVGKAVVAGVELGAHQLERLLAELVVGQLIEYGVEGRLGAAAQKQLRHHASGANRAGTDLPAQSRFGLGALLGEQCGRALGENFVVAMKEWHEFGGQPAGSQSREAAERNPANVDVRIRQSTSERGDHGLVATANRGQHGRCGRAQVDALGVQEVDDGCPEIFGHETLRPRDEHECRAL